MKFLLFNREENFIGNIKYVTSATHPEALNGEDILELTTLDNSIEKGYRIVYKDIYGYWKEFIVRGIEEVHNSDGKINHIFCESSFYETIGDYVEDKRPQDTSASLALLSALESARWEVGLVDDLGINSTNFYHISVKEAVQKVVETWKGELRTRVIVSGNKITHRYVDILQNRGQDLGKRFVYSKDITEIKRIVQRDDVITALYGYGKGEEIGEGYGRRIDFSTINSGKAYVENNDARLIWGRQKADGTKAHIFSKVEFDDVTDVHELLQLATDKLTELSQPLITYEVRVIDLKAYGLDHEGTELGDTVGIIDKSFNPELRLKAKVIEIKRDLLNNENNNIVLGNFRANIIDSNLDDREFINNFRSKSGVWDRSGIINQDGSINANILNDLVDELNSQMNSTGGYVYISQDGKGIITYDKPLDQEPTQAIQILGGSIRIANSKLPDGEWNWRTFGTGDGFVADLITTGKLNGALIEAGSLTANQIMVSSETTLGEYATIVDDNISQLLLTNGEFSTRIQSIEANMNFQYMQDTAPLNPNIGDVWFSTSSEVFLVNNLLMLVDEMTETVLYYGNSLNKSYRWNGSAWKWIEDGAITELRHEVSEIDQTTDALSLKVTSVETDAINLQSRVLSAEQKITDDAIVSMVKSKATTGENALAKKGEMELSDEALELRFENMKSLNGVDGVIEGGVVSVNKDRLKITHTGTDQFSEMRADGFVRKWEFGEAKYLNGIYVVPSLSSETDRTVVYPVTITLPAEFKGRGGNVDIILNLREFYPHLWMSVWSSGWMRWFPKYFRVRLDIVSTNFDLTYPEVVVNAYIEMEREVMLNSGAGRDYTEKIYRDIDFDVLVIGK